MSDLRRILTHLSSVALPAAIGLFLLGAAASGPDALDARGLHALIWVSAIGLLVGVGATLRRQFLLDARIATMVRDVRRIMDGEVHRYVAAPPDDPLAALSATVNEMADGLRKRQLGAETERALDAAMVRETPNGLVVIDGRGRVRRHNPAFARLMPIQGDPIGRAPIDTVPVPELQEVIDETSRTRALSERTASIGRREVLVRGLPLADGEGCLGVVLDITSVRLAERARRDFVANVSHELRTPITAVVGYSESLLQDRDQLPAWAGPMLEAIERNGRRLAALIEDVLHLSRIEARQDDLRLEREPLRPLIRDVLERCAPAARQRDIALRLADGPELEARVNAEAFEHALNNLVDNAVKYSAPGGAVVVAMREAPDGVRVSVTDQGIGIDPVHHERIFERFYRVDPGRSRDVGGTGLGLALVKHLCLAMHADIALESEAGKGSCFTLTLPR